MFALATSPAVHSPCHIHRPSSVLRFSISQNWRARARQRRPRQLSKVVPGLQAEDVEADLQELPALEMEDDDLSIDIPGHRSGGSRGPRLMLLASSDTSGKDT